MNINRWGWEPCIFGPDRIHRYSLWRDWYLTSEDLLHAPHPAKYAMFIGLNPSTADETNDDPTIRRCIAFAKSWGFGGLCMTNIFAFRATDPNDMKKAADPIGTLNDHILANMSVGAGVIVAAWGTHGEFKDRGMTVRSNFRGMNLQCLGTTKDGYPKHPLYLAKSTKLQDYHL